MIRGLLMAPDDDQYEIVDEEPRTEMEPVRGSGPPRKWGPGDRMTLVGFDSAAIRGDMLWWKGRPIHAHYVVNWSYQKVRMAIWAGRLRYARVRDEYNDWLRDELLGRDREER